MHCASNTPALWPRRLLCSSAALLGLAPTWASAPAPCLGPLQSPTAIASICSNTPPSWIQDALSCCRSVVDVNVIVVANVDVVVVVIVVVVVVIVAVLVDVIVVVVAIVDVVVVVVALGLCFVAWIFDSLFGS